MADILNLKINERSNVQEPNLRVTTIENKIHVKGYEDRQNREWCGISNERTTPKFANF